MVTIDNSIDDSERIGGSSSLGEFLKTYPRKGEVKKK